MIKYYNNGVECHKYEEGQQPEGYVLGLMKYTDLDSIDFYNEFVPYYKLHSRADIAKYFNITENLVKVLCKKYGYKKDWSYIRYTKYKNENILPDNIEVIINSINWEEYKEYYESHTRDETCEKFGIYRRLHEYLCEEHGIDKGDRKHAIASNKRNAENKRKNKLANFLEVVGSWDNFIDYYKNNSRADTIKHFNFKGRCDVDLICDFLGFRKSPQDIRKTSARKYFYDNIWFDSLPEVAVYIYYKDHNTKIEVEPIEFIYIYNNKEYKYIPDFMIDNNLVEVKGDYFFKNDGTMCNPYDHNQDAKYEAKHQCGLANNVAFWRYNEYKFALDYLVEIDFDISTIKRSKVS